MNLNNIFIVGLMGSGKTSIGKLLAKRTGRLFIDTDNEIIKESDMTITEIFNKFGENHFRDLEHKILLKAKWLHQIQFHEYLKIQLRCLLFQN